MNKNTIPLINIAIVIICFGLGGLGLVIHNINNDEKNLRLRLEEMGKEDRHQPWEVMDSEMMLETESPDTPDGGDEPDDSSKEE